jgi:methyltransferase
VVIPEGAYLLLLAAVAGQRGLELVLSRRNARIAFRRGAIEVGQSHFKVMAAMHILFLASCAVESVTRDLPFAPAIGMLALAGTIVAQVLRYWTMWTLGERWNTRIIVIPGEPPITGGPFRYLRHPNYLAVVIEMACIPLIGGLWITAAIFSVLNAAILSVRMSIEERALGSSYAEAFAARPRLVPRLR